MYQVRLRSGRMSRHTLLIQAVIFSLQSTTL